ncbi:MAG: bifunctional hydroxymethylpyrimidine kinase/phosphomethylpyrimidine kinase, partial [Planctomycetota bacterium]
DDLDVKAIKIGMLGDTAMILAVAARLASVGEDIPIVLDPVMVAATGASLLADDAISALRERMLPLATLVTPNLPEAARLLDTTVEEILANPERAGEQLTDLGALASLIKGGHETGTPMATDWFHDGGTLRRLSAKRLDTPHTHGTGCTLSSAIAARLAAGVSLPEAIGEAKEYVTRAIQAADALGVGHGHGPVHHFHQWWS